jgi:hypothetical protein
VEGAEANDGTNGNGQDGGDTTPTPLDGDSVQNEGAGNDASTPKEDGDGADGDQTTSPQTPSPAANPLPPLTGDRVGDALAMKDRPIDAATTGRMEELGYTAKKNSAGEVISYSRSKNAAKDLPEVRVKDGEITRVREESIRIGPGGEHMIKNKDGTMRPVSEMADPSKTGDDGRRHNPQVGRWGEVQADRYAKTQGWEKVSGPDTTLDSPFTGPNRIDAVDSNPNPPPGPYVITDAKALGSGQGTTKDGTLQMSQPWIDARLAKSGVSQEHMDAMQVEGSSAMLLHVDNTGTVSEIPLDANGKKT